MNQCKRCLMGIIKPCESDPINDCEQYADEIRGYIDAKNEKDDMGES